MKKSQNEEKGMKEKRCLKVGLERAVPRSNWAITVFTASWFVHLAT
ncbi:MAG TPA: hypothetical protein VFZ09_51450 [Archangium sp.]|nr:hypothetical protein [Archangium sp.]HEX5754705.1 hypothetical protein [Archangium sp.]